MSCTFIDEPDNGVWSSDSFSWADGGQNWSDCDKSDYPDIKPTDTCPIT